MDQQSDFMKYILRKLFDIFDAFKSFLWYFIEPYYDFSGAEESVFHALFIVYIVNFVVVAITEHLLFKIVNVKVSRIVWIFSTFTVALSLTIILPRLLMAAYRTYKGVNTTIGQLYLSVHPEVVEKKKKNDETSENEGDETSISNWKEDPGKKGQKTES